MKKEIKLYKVDNILYATEPDSVFFVKKPSSNVVETYITTISGQAVPLKDLQGGGSGGSGITSLLSADGSVEITGTSTSKNLQVSSALQALINSALQANDAISSLLNDAGYITLSDVPTFNPADYDLTDFTNNDADPFARMSDIPVDSGIQSVVAGDRVTVDVTNPLNPVVSADLQTDNNFTDALKTKLDGIEAGAEVNNISDTNVTDLTDGTDTTLHTHDGRYYTETEVDSLLDDKVDKVVGKQLSTEDYTTSEKSKLAGIEAGAEVNVNADWSATSGDAQILNKPIIPDVSGFVPYTGATQNADLGEYQLKVGQLEFDQTPTGTAGVGKMRWNNTDGTVDLGLKGGNVTLQLGQEQVARVVNKTSPLINLLEVNYQVVKVVGATGQRLSVALAQADSSLNSAVTLGVVTETINADQEGFVTTNGQVKEINTTGSLQGETWNDGDVLYLSPTVAGQLTKNRPSAPNKEVVVGFVEYAHANHGKIFVKVDTGLSLNEVDDVTLTTPANNNVLSYNSTTQLWENKSVATALGYTPENVSNKATNLTSPDNNKYPTTLAVATALALKLDANASSIIAETTTDGTASSGTANTVSSSVLIPAERVVAGNILDCISSFKFAGTSGARNMRMYVNTTPNLMGSPILVGALTNSIASNLQAHLQRFLVVKVTNGTGAGTEILNTANNVVSQYGISTTAVQTVAINWTINQYIIVAVQAANAGDSLRSTFLKVRR